MTPIGGWRNGRRKIFALAAGIGILPAMPRRGYRATAAITAVFAGLGLAVAGCDGHSKPFVASEPPQTPAPVTSASLSPSATPSPSDSPGPREGSPGSPTSSPIVGISALNSAYPSAVAAEPAAIQVVRDFYEGINHEIDTGDETAVSKVIDPACTQCITEVVNVKNLLDGAHHIRNGHLHIVSVDKVYPSYSNVVSVIITGTADASDQVDAGGKVVQSFAAVPPTQVVFDILIDRSPPVIGLLTRVRL